MMQSGKVNRQNELNDKVKDDDIPLETDEDIALRRIVGKQIKRVRQGFFKDAQEKLGEQVFSNYGQNIMFRLEKGSGSAINVLKLLHYFHQHGVNLNYLFEEDANEFQMMQYNLNAQDAIFTRSIISRYESAMANLYKLKDLNSIAIDKNINDMKNHIESISKLTTVESIDLEKNS